jgi:hypothetical protein
MLKSSISAIQMVMELGLKRINDNPQIDVDKLFRRAANGEERTVLLKIYEDPASNESGRTVFCREDKVVWSQGLAHRDHQIIRIQLPKETDYTVRYKLTASAWYRLITQQNTMRDLFWSNLQDAEGDFFVRDFIVWAKFWSEYAPMLKLNAVQRALMKDRKEM